MLSANPPFPGGPFVYAHTGVITSQSTSSADWQHVQNPWPGNGNLSEANKEFSRLFIKDDQIIGWLITFPLANETLDYRILWVDGKHRKTGVAIRALAEIIRQAHFQENDAMATSSTNNDRGIPCPKGFFVVHAGNEAMNHFAAKRLAQGTSQQSQLIYREKRISRPLE